MKRKNECVICHAGNMWIQTETNNSCHESRHNKLSHAIEHATEYLQKNGGGKLKIKDEQHNTLIYSYIKK